MRYLYFLLFTLSVFSQNKPLDLKIDTISSTDSITNLRIFHIKYHIENLTVEEISFFLKPNSFLPAHNGSMGTSALYKLYQNNEVLNVSEIFSNTLKKDIANQPDFSLIKDEKEREIAMKKYLKEKYNLDYDSISLENKKENADSDYYLKQSSKRLMNSIYTLKPKQIKEFTYTFYWDKTRYYKEDVYEYYLNENSKFYLELYLILIKEHYKEKILPKDFEKIMENENFIQGVFTSNKIEINFNE